MVVAEINGLTNVLSNMSPEESLPYSISFSIQDIDSVKTYQAKVGKNEGRGRKAECTM